MTREDAINIMKVIVHMLEEKYDTERVEDAVNMAIKSLEQEPCEDAISRQEAIKSIGKYFLRVETNGTIEIHQKLFSEFLKAINETQKNILLDLPSVHTKAKVGKWITWSEEIKCDGYTEYRTHCKCSECDKEHDSYSALFIRYCSNCGAKMEGVQE